MAKTFAVAGKGGTGKSTIAALIVRHLIQRNAGPVLAMDADPDANLGTLLGVKPEQSVGDLREELLKNIKSLPAGMSKQAYMEAGLHQIVAESRGFDLISMGRGEGPGCYCYLNSLIRKFSEDLAPSYAWVVMDNEAGLEHLSRRTAYSIDTLFVVVNESPLSHDTARRIGSVLGAIKNNVRTTRLITNMVRPERLAEVRQRLAAIGMEYAGDVPRDPALEDAVLAGCTILSLEQSPAIDSVNHIMETL